MLKERILDFIGDPGAGDFDELALEAFATQFEGITAYRGLCEGRGLVPGEVTSWDEIPMVPTMAFKTMGLELEGGDEGAAGDEEIAVFRSSGTTGSQRSVHRHLFPELYRATIDNSFPDYCLPAGSARVPILSLVPTREVVPDSSLSFMTEHAVETWGDESSTWAMGPRGVDFRTLRSWLAARQREGRPAVVLSTSLALVDALDALDRFGLRFRLPPGSILFETGGTKGRTKGVSADETQERVESLLAVPREAIVREYGMTELTSQLYARSMDGQPATAYEAPHWCRVRIVDPQTLSPVAESEVGMVAIFDLANLGSAVHVLTEDLGRLEDGRLHLEGRAAGAELRGCSLTAEELAAATPDPA